MTEQAVPYFLAEPAIPNGRGVVLCCDGQGLAQFDIRLAQRFAREGYWAAAPEVYFRFGGGDEHIKAEMLATVRDRHPDDVVIYPEARHGFMKDDRAEYDPDAASDAWGRVLSFLSGA